MLRQAALALVLAGSLAGCRIEDHTPSGTRRDEDAVRAVVATYYRSVSQKMWASGRSVFWDSATVSTRPMTADTNWLTFRTSLDYFTYLARSYRTLSPGSLGPRLVRTDFRQSGDVAAIWATVRMTPPAAGVSGEIQRVDHFVLRRIQGAWRIVDLVSVPDSGAVRT